MANIDPVLLSFALQVIYILVPIIPAVIIYKMFPETTVTVQGTVVSNWRVKAGGAFAAYIVTVLLGYFLARGTQKLIEGLTDTAWTISGDVVLLDRDGKPVNDADKLLKSLDVEVHPPPKDVSGNHLAIRIPVERDDPSGYRLHISIPEFGATDYSLDTSSKTSSYTIKPDFDKRQININPRITIQSVVEAGEKLPTSGESLKPLPKNAGPPPATPTISSN